MEDIVAVKVVGPEDEAAFFITWGRIQAPVDPSALEALVIRFASQFGVPNLTSPG